MTRRPLLNALVLAPLLLTGTPAHAAPPAADSSLHACRVALQAASLRDALPLTLQGDARAFADTQRGAARLVGQLAGTPLAASVQRHADQLLARQLVMQRVATALAAIPPQADPLLESIDTLYGAELLAAASAARQGAANQLGMLSQRLGKSALELTTAGKLSAEAVYRLGKDTRSFQRLLKGLGAGDAELRLPPARSAASKAQVAAVEREFAPLKANVDIVLGNLKDFVAAWEAQAMLAIELQALGQQAGGVCLQSAAAPQQ